MKKQMGIIPGGVEGNKRAAANMSPPLIAAPSGELAANICHYNLGLLEQVIFPEINYDKIDKIRGMDITIVTTAQTDEEARVLLTKFGMPFTK